MVRGGILRRTVFEKKTISSGLRCFGDSQKILETEKFSQIPKKSEKLPQYAVSDTPWRGSILLFLTILKNFKNLKNFTIREILATVTFF